ncbi:MAG: DNRLRE domain-containing protein [Anaerolineales bacterium]
MRLKSLQISFQIICIATLISILAGSTFLPVVAASEENGLPAFTKISLYPNIETMGVVVTGSNLPKTAQLLYRQENETAWRTGHLLMRIDSGRLVGSLFGLSAATSYFVKVVDGATEISNTASTQVNELQFVPTVVLHVNANAPLGGNGSSASPFRTIRDAVNRAKPGTQVLVADGVYHESVSFPVSGTTNNWIQVKAEGNGAVLEGSENLSGNIWQPYDAKKHIWVTKIKTSIRYLARNGQRFYMYDNLTGLINASGHNKVAMEEGWYMAPGTLKLYVRSIEDPSKYTWQVPTLNHAFDISSHDWIWIEGFEMRFYGTASGCGVCTKNSSHIVVRKNNIHNMQNGVYIYWNGTDKQGNDTRIEYNEIYDPSIDEWPWKSTKATSMEGTAIVVSAHIGTIVRENHIHNFFNGIYTGSSAGLENSGIAFDADIYNNNIHQITDDGLEPEGACINNRFRNNKVDTTLVGISLAPITQGPTWVVRSVFSNYTGSSIKWDLKSDGAVLIYHNTSWTNEKDVNAMSMISPTQNSIMRNNIFQGNGYAFEAPFTGSLGHDWNYDDWYTTCTDGPHFVWEKKSYNTVSDLCKGAGLECNGFEDVPGLVDPANGNYSLLSSSSNIDRGVVIPGIDDDFAGKAPDLGAFEFGYNPLPRLLSIVRADTNPSTSSTIHFKISFSESVTGVDASDFVLSSTGTIANAAITAVSGLRNAYTVTVDTGSGDGTLRLDLVDNDSILDEGGQPLGGVGSGTVALGEEYAIVKSPKIFLQTLVSNGVNDGWVIEASENANIGNGYNAVSPTFYLGDNAEDRQFLTILDFSTASLPDNAVISSVTLRIKKLSVTGTDPFTTHQNVLVDIKSSSFDLPTLQTSDFQSAASLDAAATILNTPTDNWYSTQLDANTSQYINKTGNTQFRLRFQLDDNDDGGADTIKFHSGDAVFDNRPQLLIEYYVLN